MKRISKNQLLLLILLSLTFGCKKYKAPELKTDSINTITYTSANCIYTIISDGGKPITERGVCYSTSESPTINDTKKIDNTYSASFSSSLTGLVNNTTYYVRAYAINEEGTSYGDEVSFSTLKYNLPSVMTTAVTNIINSNATSGGNVTSDGGSPVTARGVCWNTSPNPTVINNHTVDGNGLGSFTSNITGLSNSTTYYIRAYAYNSEGISYGNEIIFIAGQGYTSPTVTTNNASGITENSAYCGGVVTADGGTSVYGRGICWSTNQNPSTSDAHISDGTGLGNFGASLTGLSSNTSYYVRAYATNNIGTSYGNQVIFTTLSPTSLATLTTNSATSITQTTATSGGNITSNGGSVVTARGVCWSTSSNPTIANTHTTNGTGNGTFTSNISGLNAGTNYYVRAYATNTAGTAYGNQLSFTTTSTILAIGDSYGGGIIAYIFQPGDPGYVAGQTHGLIAAPSDQNMAVWGCYNTAITGANGTDLGTGNQNTIDIIGECLTAGIAAKLCFDLVLNGYNDWYLPSKDELNKLYINKVAIGGFTNSYYWSSSEYAGLESIVAWGQYFNSGIQLEADKSYANSIRPVRNF